MSTEAYEKFLFAIRDRDESTEILARESRKLQQLADQLRCLNSECVRAAVWPVPLKTVAPDLSLIENAYAEFCDVVSHALDAWNELDESERNELQEHVDFIEFAEGKRSNFLTFQDP